MRPAAALFLVLLALADAGLWYAAFRFGSPATVWSGAIHAGVTLAALRVLHGSGLESDGWNGLALPLGAALGPLGILALGLLRPWPKHARNHAHGLEISPAESLDDAREMPGIVARLRDHRLRFPAPDQLQSLATILRYGDLANRCKALETAVRSFEPRLSPLIAAALSDPDQTMRALAAATSAQVSARLTERIARFEANPPAEAAERHAYAMMLFENGCNNVLLSQSQRAAMREKAKTQLLQLLRRGQLDGERHDSASAALIRLGVEPLRSAAIRPITIHPGRIALSPQ